MGKTLAKLFGKKDMRILMLGLDAAGKTSILPIITGDYRVLLGITGGLLEITGVSVVCV